MAITKEEHRYALEIEEVRANIQRMRFQSQLAEKDLLWYERVFYIAIGGLAFNGLSCLI